MAEQQQLLDGPTFIAKCLAQQQIQYIFGIVGVPITPIAVAAQKEGIKFFGFRYFLLLH